MDCQNNGVGKETLAKRRQLLENRFAISRNSEEFAEINFEIARAASSK